MPELFDCRCLVVGCTDTTKSRWHDFCSWHFHYLSLVGRNTLRELHRAVRAKEITEQAFRRLAEGYGLTAEDC